MRPSKNAIETVKIIWDTGKNDGTNAGWLRTLHALHGISLYLLVTDSFADHEYIRDMRDAAFDMMEET